MKNMTNILLAISVAFSTLPATSVFATEPSKTRMTVKYNNQTTPKAVAAEKASKFAAELAANPMPPENSKLGESDLFTQYMGYDLSRHAFREAQWELLATDGDTAYTRFFWTLNDHLGGMFDKVKALHDMQLEQASKSFRYGKSPLRQGYTPYVDRILRTAKLIATALGFPAAAIENIEVYSQRGEMNAYTVSGNHNRIIINLYSGLLENLSMGQLAGVLAHELGHIRLLHSVKGIMHNILMTVILRNYAGTQFAENLDASKGLFPMNVCRHGTDGTCSHGTHSSGEVFREDLNSAGEVSQRKLQVQMSKVITEGIQTIENLPASVRQTIMREYIYHLIQSLKDEEGPIEAIQILVEAYKLNGSIATQIDGKKLNWALEQGELAISRGQEKSADNMSTSVVPNEYLANGIVQLVGPPMDPNIRDPKLKREELEKLRQMLVDAMKETSEKYEGQDRSDYVGSTHPALGLRIYNILQVQTFPEILFADPMLKIMLLEDQIRTADEHEREGAERLLAQIRRDIVVLISARGLAKKTNVRFNKAIQYAAFNRAAALLVLQQVAPAPATDELKEGTLFLVKQLQDSLEIFRLLDKKLAEVKPANAEEKLVVEQRRQMIQDLLASNTYEKVVAVQKAARPWNADGPHKSRRLLPVSDQKVSNFEVGNLCDTLLSKATEAIAGAKARAAKANPPPHPPAAPSAP